MGSGADRFVVQTLQVSCMQACSQTTNNVTILVVAVTHLKLKSCKACREAPADADVCRPEEAIDAGGDTVPGHNTPLYHVPAHSGHSAGAGHVTSPHDTHSLVISGNIMVFFSSQSYRVSLKYS